MLKQISQQVNQEEFEKILDKTMPDIMEIMRQFREELGGILPQEMSYGIVAGFLRGKGHSWPETIAATSRYIHVMKTHHSHASGKFNGEMTIASDGDSVAFNFGNTAG